MLILYIVIFQVELAFFSALRENPRIEFVSVPQHQAATIFVAMFMVFEAVTATASYITSITTVDLNYQSLQVNIFSFIFSMVSNALLVYFGRIYFRSLDKLAEAQVNFDVRNSACGMAQDHPLLLTTIDHYLGSEEVPGSGIQIFNELVKKNLRMHAPFSGPRSVLVVSYIPAVIIGATLLGNQDPTFAWMRGRIHSQQHNHNPIQSPALSWMTYLDIWATGQMGFTYDTWNAPWIVWQVYVYAVANPMRIYSFLAFLKVMWWFEKWCSVKNVFLVIGLYAFFLLFDTFVPIRLWLWAIAVFWSSGSIADSWRYFWYPFPFTQWPSLLTASQPFGMGLYSHGDWPKLFSVPVWSRVLIVIWMVLSSLGIYWLFESAYLQRLRLKAWGWVQDKIPLFRKDDRYID